MQLVNWKNLKESQGNFLLIYGPSGGGKTATTLQTSEDPIAYFTAEKRKIETTMKAINRPDLRMGVGVYEGFNDLIDTISEFPARDGKREVKTKTVVIDSFTHLMAAQLAFEILDQDYAAKTPEEQNAIIKELTMMVKLSKESYGSIADNMLRLMNGLQNLTMAGYDVVCTARAEERPKYNKALGYGPSLAGQKFGNIMPGYFDFIAMLEPAEHEADDDPPAIDADIKVLWKYHAPLASFDNNDSYLAKWTGPFPPKGIIKRKFSVKKLFEEGNGIYR
jgi:hypothetical protein